MKYKVLICTLIAVSLLTGCASLIPKTETETEPTTADTAVQQTSADYILPSDTNVINEVDLSMLNPTQLKYAYAEIFARHGKVFEDANYKRYFESKNWYVPDPSFSDDKLTDVEAANAAYILEYIEKSETTTAEPTTSAPVTQAQTQAPVVQQAAPAPASSHAMRDSYTSRAHSIENYVANSHATDQETYYYGYQQWDTLLNEVYQHLKATMSSAEFENLKQDERNWVAQKEAAASQYTGAMCFMTSMEYTAERTYYLISLVED